MRLLAFLDDEFERLFRRHDELAGIDELEKFRIRDQFRLREIIAADKEKPAKQGERKGKKEKTAPVHRRLTAGGALAVVVGGLGIFF